MFNLKQKKIFFSRLILVIGVYGVVLFKLQGIFFQSRPAICAWIIHSADFENECPFTFEMNSEAVIKEKKIADLHYVSKNESDYLFDLQTCK
jgi:hypothetical protein